MPLSVAELGYLRDDHPHKTLLYMSVYRPATVYVGQITGSPARGARQITVSDVSGTIGNIVEGMTLLVGSTSGDDNITRRRFRSRSGQVLTVDENSVVWENGQYVTAINMYELWPVFPFIDDTEPYTFYKDRDITYSDQNEQPSPVAIMGDHRAKFLESGTAVFSLSAVNSYAIANGASISSYAWSCPSGTIANATAATTTITFNAAVPDGVYVTLTVTDSNGKTQTTRRVFWVHDRTGSNTPYKDFQFSSPIVGAWDAGGYKAVLDVYGVADVDEIPDKTIVLIWQEAYYSGTIRDINSQGSTLFAGYTRQETIVRNLAAGRVQFEVVTIDELLRSRETFSISLVDDANPDTWWKYKDLTVRRALHHLLRWHSTLLTVCDVFIANSDLRLPACDDFAEGDFYSMIEGFVNQHGIHAHVCSNKRGQLYIEIDIQMLNDAGRDAIDELMEITATDRRDLDDFYLTRRKEGNASFVMLSGIMYDGSTTTPLISKSPGEVPEAYGTSKISVENQVLASQTDANERAGRVQALVNNILTNGQIKCAGNYSFFDIVPQNWVTISMTASENKRGLEFTDMRFVPRSVSLLYDFQGGVLFSDITADAEAIGEDGIPGDYPTVPGPGPSASAPPEDNVGQLLVFDSVSGCHVYTSWEERNGGLTGVNKQDQAGGVDPWWIENQSSFDPSDAILWKCDVGKIYRSMDQGQTWVNETPSTDPPNGAEDDPAPTAGDLTYFWYEGNLIVNHQHVFLAKWQNASDEWRSWILLTEDDGQTWEWKFVGVEGSGGDFILTTPTSTTSSFIRKKIMQFTANGGCYGVSYKHRSGGTDSYYISFYDTDGNHLFNGLLDDHATVGAIEGMAHTPVKLTETTFAVVITIKFTGVTTPLLGVKFFSIDWDGNTISEDSYGILEGTGSDIRVYRYNQEIVKVFNDTVMIVSYCVDISIGENQIYVYVVSQDGASTALIDSYIAQTSGTASMFEECIDFYEVDGGSPRIYHAFFAWGVTQYELIGLEIKLDDAGLIQYTDWNVLLSVNAEGMAAAHIGGVRSMIAYFDVDEGYNLWGIHVAMESSSVELGVPSLIDGASSYSTGIGMGSNGVAAKVVYADTSDNLIYRVLSRDGSGVDAGAAVTIDTATSVAFFRTVTVHNDLVVAYQKTVSTIRLAIGSFASAARAIGLSISKGTGVGLYVTALTAGELACYVYSLPALTELLSLSLGVASDADVDDFSKIVYPYAIIGDDNVCRFYGRFTVNAITHLALTEDGGQSLTVLEDDLGESYVAAYAMNGAGRSFAVVNNGSIGKLYSGYLGLTEKLTLPFQVNVNCIATFTDRYLIIGGRSVGGGQMVLRIKRPFDTVDLDITDNYPLTGHITGVVIT